MAEKTSTQTKITGAALYAMGDVGPCELIDGEIVPTSPTGGRHAAIESYLAAQLTLFIQKQRLGWVMTGEVGIYTAHNPDRIRAADVAVFTRAQLSAGPPDGFIDAAPELVVEIVSPSDRWSAVQAKVEEYLDISAQQVWVIDPERQTVAVYDISGEVQTLGANAVLNGAGKLQGFSLSLEDLFSL